MPVVNGLPALREAMQRERQEVFEILTVAGMICTLGFEPLKIGSQHLIQDGQMPPADHFIIVTADDRLVLFGGHAIFIDALAFLPHLSQQQYPAQSLGIALYQAAGIRGCELGSVAFGRHHTDGSEEPAALELLRLAFPRRVYTQSHLDYLLEALTHLAGVAQQIPGVRITWLAPQLRHFSARFALLEEDQKQGLLRGGMVPLPGRI